MPTFDPNQFGDSFTSRDVSNLTVHRIQNNLQRQWERFLESPSPTTERLVDQALVNAGRSPMFSHSGVYQGRGHVPFQSPRFSAQQTTQALINAARGSVGRTGLMGYRGPGYADLGFAGRAYAQQPPPMQAGASSVTLAMGAERTWTELREIKKLLKTADVELGDLKQVERRILAVQESSLGPSAQRQSVNMLGNFVARMGADLNRRTPTGVAPWAIGAALGRAMGGAPAGFAGGGAGGVGGGGGGGAAGGGGFGGGGFQGGILGGILGGNFRRFGAVGIGAEEILQGIKLHLRLGQIEQSVLASSNPYAQWTSQLANLTRNTGNLGRGRPTDLFEGFHSAFLPQTDERTRIRMAQLGITQPGMMESLERMGGARPGQGSEMIYNLRRLRLGGAFAALPEGSVEALALGGQKFGMAGLGHPEMHPAAFSNFLAQGQAAGADPLDLLRTIATATETLAKTGIKLDPSGIQGWAEFLRRSQMSAVPEARAGIMGGNILSGFQGVGKTPFGNPVSALIFGQIIANTNWKDPKAVEALLGKAPAGGRAPWEQTTLQAAQINPMNPLTMIRLSRMISGSSGGLSRVEQVIRSQFGVSGPEAREMAEQMMGIMTGGDFVQGSEAMRAASGAPSGSRVRGRGMGARLGVLGGANRLNLPEEQVKVFQSQTEAFTELFRGMYIDFHEFADNIKWLNRVLENAGAGFGTTGRHGGLGGGDSPWEAFKRNWGWLWGGGGGGGAGAPIPPGPGGATGGGLKWPGTGGRIPGKGFGAQPGVHGGWTGLTPGRQAAAAAGALPMGAMEAISKAEGTWGQSGIDWNIQSGEKPGQASKKLEDMTISQVYSQQGPDFGGLQINRVNLLPGAAALGLDPSTTKFTPEVQQRMAAWVHSQQGLGAWKGFNRNSDLRNQAQKAIEAARAGSRFGDREAPAGTPPMTTGTATVTTPSGRKIQVAAEFAANFQGFLNDYEKMGGRVGPASGGISARPGNASFHPVGRAIDVNQVARNVRQGGVTLPQDVEDQLAKKWGLYPGSQFSNPDAGHFEVRSAEEARVALERMKGIASGPLGPAGTWSTKSGKRITTEDADKLIAESNRSNIKVEHAPPTDNSKTSADQTGGGGNMSEVHSSMEYLGRMARETAEHIGTLGEHARGVNRHRAGHGGHAALGPNPSTSPPPSQSGQAYGG